jgi:hypothetical protein
MRRLALLAAAVYLIFCYGMDAKAQTWSTGPVAVDHYVGPSKGQNDGDTHGRGGMNALCQNTYGVTAHMCSTDEFMNTASIPKGTSIPEMWVYPTWRNCYYDGGREKVMCEMAGIGLIELYASNYQCSEWTDNSNQNSGTVIWEYLGCFQPANIASGSGYGPGCEFCNKILPVACCAP